MRIGSAAAAGVTAASRRSAAAARAMTVRGWDVIPAPPWGQVTAMLASDPGTVKGQMGPLTVPPNMANMAI
jgi:hypothetical protein